MSLLGDGFDSDLEKACWPQSLREKKQFAWHICFFSQMAGESPAIRRETTWERGKTAYPSLCVFFWGEGRDTFFEGLHL